MLFVAQNVVAQSFDQPKKDSLLKAMNSYLNKLKVNGSVLVCEEDSILYEKYAGYINFKTKQKITPSTPFHIASTSKTFTAMSVMKLYQEGKLDVYAPVSRYLEQFPYSEITIAELLSHRSGVKYYAFFLPRKTSKKFTNQDVLDYLAKYKPRLEFTPNTRFKYCNTNYAILALLIEKVSGKSYEDFLKENFFLPYQMNNTFVLDKLEKRVQTTPSYTARRRYAYGFTSLDLIYGDKNIYSTARDLAQWNRALLDTTLFHKKTLDLAYKIFSPLPYKNIVKGYGLGWRIFYTKDYYKVVYHNGWWHGNKAFFLRIPDLGIGIVAMNNVSSSVVYGLTSLLKFLIPDIDYSFEEWENLLQSESSLIP